MDLRICVVLHLPLQLKPELGTQGRKGCSISPELQPYILTLLSIPFLGLRREPLGSGGVPSQDEVPHGG